MKLSRTTELDPTFVFKKYSKLKQETKIDKLIIKKYYSNCLQDIVKNNLSGINFTYNVFRITKNKQTSKI